MLRLPLLACTMPILHIMKQRLIETVIHILLRKRELLHRVTGNQIGLIALNRLKAKKMIILMKYKIQLKNIARTNIQQIKQHR